MDNYFDEHEYFLNKIWFDLDGCRHNGSGVMSWNPNTGFHIAAQMVRNKPFSGIKVFKTISIDKTIIIRMKLDDGRFAFIPRAYVNAMGLLVSWRFSQNVNRVVFKNPISKELSSTMWLGSALYLTNKDLLFPDSVTRETTIGDGRPYEHLTRSGICYKDSFGQEIRGLMDDKKHLKLHWSLPKSVWKKGHSWRYSRALMDAISISAGDSLQLLHQEVYRGRYVYEEMRMVNKPTSLGVELRPLDYNVLDKEVIVHLANFLVSNSIESNISRRIFQQLAEAALQKSHAAKELLLATILEAALRHLYNQPFDPIKNKRTDDFSIAKYLKQFRETYLSDDVQIGRKWKKITNDVKEVHKRLRDRNAHPDWLFTESGEYSAEKLEGAINDMIFLSRFYGYMILALAGYRNLQPSFPEPIDNWSPLLSISRF